MATTALVLERQLETARREIAALRKLTDHTLAIIIASGGTVVLPDALVQQTHDGCAEWRHEFESGEHTFKAWLKAT